MSSMPGERPPFQNTDPKKPWYVAPLPEVPGETEEWAPGTGPIMTPAEKAAWVQRMKEGERKAEQAMNNYRPPKSVEAIVGKVDKWVALRLVQTLRMHRLTLMSAGGSSDPEKMKARAMKIGEQQLRGLLPNLPKEKMDQLLQPGLDLAN
ncbi:MAG: hypothetical protein AB9869_00100 [Verrucomicrobiia bacterium]